jgi:PAS domain S-box-containing protein
MSDRIQELEERVAALSRLNEGLRGEAREAARLIEALRESDVRYREFVSQVKDYAIFRMDPEGRALSWNEGVDNVLGYAREEFIGSSVELAFLPEDVAAGIPWRELEVARTTGSANDDRWMRRKDGAAFFAAGRTMRVTDGNGNCIGFTKVLRDETQRVLAEERQSESQARFRALVQNIPDYAIFLLDAGGLVTEWTEGAQRVKGYTPQETLGHHLAMFYTPEDIAAGEPQRELRQASDMGRVEREGWRIRKGGERFWVNEIATAIRGDDGKLLGFTKISRDLTERKRSEQALAEADQRKDEFLAVLAHELRNPLAPLRNGLQILRLTGKEDLGLQLAVNMMERQLKHLVRLVDDLLDVARITSGKVELHRGQVDLNEALNASIEASRVAIDQRSHELVMETVGEPVWVEGDFHRLTQVFSNLLSNAAKYTDAGGRIALRLRRTVDAATVTVTDTGIGIPTADLRLVFDLFSQVRSHQGRGGGGLGIGLSLVKSLVSLHNGTVTASSAGPGAGSTFEVHLPLARSVTAPKLSERQDRPRPVPRRRILVVDDNVDAAASLATVLEFEGHDVTVAHDGQEAVMKAAGLNPNIVFLDIGMPTMNGIDAARRLRSLPSGERMLVVALTGWGQLSDRARTREAGFDIHLVKPVDPDAIRELLASNSPRLGDNERVGEAPISDAR